MKHLDLARLIPSVLFLFFACLGLVEAPHVILWKLSILTTEYGHWFAVMGLVVIFFILRNPSQGDGIRVLPVLILIIASGLFLRPALLAATRSSAWQDSLTSSFPGSSSEKPDLFRWSVLWLGHGHRTVQPQTLVYSTPSSGALELDLYLPPRSGTEVKVGHPWVLVIHGGGWDSGERKQLSELNSRLAEKGYAVASISYRLAPEAKWPAQKDDVLAAVTFLKENAVGLGLDPDRWVILGRSAGGQIAEAVGYSLKDPTLKGVIGFYAPADMSFAYKFSEENDILNSRNLLRNYLGGPPESALANYEDASGIRFVRPLSPPTLLFHGANDALVWHRQSERLEAKLREDQVPVVFISLDWATHGFDFNLSGPGGQISTAAIEFFLGRVFGQSS